MKLGEMDQNLEALALQPKAAKVRQAKARPEPEETKPENLPVMEKRLMDMVNQDRVPIFIAIESKAPEPWAGEPTGFGIQARREWEGVAESLSIPCGDFLAYQEYGVVYKASRFFIIFNIQALWKHLGIG